MPHFHRRNAEISVRLRLVSALIVTTLLTFRVIASRAVETGSAAAPGRDYLPNIELIDQYGHPVTLASFKGKPAVVGFIHTSCGGVCELLTAKMKNVAENFDPSFGSKITLITITTDPKEDRPQQLQLYSKDQGATESGWVFLTGKPENVAEVLRLYGVPDGPDDALTHVFELRLIGANGTELKSYKGASIQSSEIVRDVREVLAHRE
jgi:cytochrome oxidase Cu insertion factor (SCO1/SenC/PrrC family)